MKIEEFINNYIGTNHQEFIDDLVAKINELADAINELDYLEARISLLEAHIAIRKQKPELLPCPFCASYPIVESNEYCVTKENRFRILCKICISNKKLMPSTYWFDEEQEAIKAWNTRK